MPKNIEKGFLTSAVCRIFAAMKYLILIIVVLVLCSCQREEVGTRAVVTEKDSTGGFTMTFDTDVDTAYTITF